MASELVYLDASALVKLVLYERETEGLWEFLRPRRSRVTSLLSAIELSRAVRRLSGSKVDAMRSRDVLADVALLSISEDVVTAAAALDPPELRSLDAIHLATALTLGSDLGSFVVYDDRLASAARRSGLRVASPG